MIPLFESKQEIPTKAEMLQSWSTPIAPLYVREASAAQAQVYEYKSILDGSFRGSLPIETQVYRTTWLPSVVPPIHAVKPVLPISFAPRRVQKTMMTRLFEAYRQGFKSPVVMAMTGTGKTKWTAWLFNLMLNKNPNQRLMFVVPRITLIDQTYAEFKAMGLNPSVIWQKDARFDASAQVHISSKDTLVARFKSENPEVVDFFSNFRFDLVVWDEAHKRTKVISKVPCKWYIGLTASPFSKGLGHDYDTLIKTENPDVLIADGTIKPLVAMAASAVMDEAHLIMGADGEYTEASEQLAANQIVGNVVSDLNTIPEMQHRTWIAACRSIATCEYLYEKMREAGINVGMVHSKLAKSHNEQVLKDFKLGLYAGVISINMLIEGFDNPQVDMVLVLTSLASAKWDATRPNNLNMWVQFIGRGRRTYPNATDCLVVDYGNNWARFGSPDRFLAGITELDTHQPKEKIQAEMADKTPKPKECPTCRHFFDKGKVCPHCGHELTTFTQYIEGEPVQFINGKIKLVSGKTEPKHPRDLSLSEKQAVWQGFKWDAYYFGQSQLAKGKYWDSKKEFGRAIGNYKAMFGVEPPKARAFRDAPRKHHALAAAYVERSFSEWLQKQRRASYAKRSEVRV